MSEANDSVSVPREILERIAGLYPVITWDESDWSNHRPCCGHCGEYIHGDDGTGTDKVLSHKSDCPWVAIRKLLGDREVSEESGVKIVVTARNVLDKGSGTWDRFCAMKGLDPWGLNTGKFSSKDEFVLTENQAKELGFIQ